MTERTRHASCRCGQLRVVCTGEPTRVSVCHCRDCKARSGSVLATQVRFHADRVLFEGQSKTWVQVADSGNTIDFHFCVECGSTLWYICAPEPDIVAVAFGNFEPGHGFVPEYSVYEERKEPWVSITGETIDHYD